MRFKLLMLLVVGLSAWAQDPTGVLEGQILDPSEAVVSQAAVSVHNSLTGLAIEQHSARDGSFHFPALPVGDYDLQVSAPGFASFKSSRLHIDIGRTVRVPVRLQIEGTRSEVTVTDAGATVDLASAVGDVVSAEQATDLPLNGRDFTQLGLMQAGVAPMTAGLSKTGGLRRQGQAYAVDGQPPESNRYLLDGVANVDSVDGGFALRTPVDAIAEFRILSSNAPAEYGGTSGATTSVVTRSGGNQFHGSLFEFLRNNDFAARNFFAATTEPLHQNQFGGTVGGPVRKNRDFFFAYYEGLRDSQGETTTAIVPTPAQRKGDFSGMTDPTTGQPVPLIDYFTGAPVAGNILAPSSLNPIALKALQLYPLGNLSPSLYASTQMMANNYDQGGFRLDHYFANGDQLFARYATAATNSIDPLPMGGANVPGFGVGNDSRTHSAELSHTHVFSPATVQTVRVAFFRNDLLFTQHINTTPASALGFQYQPTENAAIGPPYLIVSGYASAGDPMVGPTDTHQNTYQYTYSLAHTAGKHSFKAGGEFDRTQINILDAIATNGFFVFAPFPYSDSFASFLTGQSVTFYQGRGQFDRGLRNYLLAGYVQDEWRITPRLTFNYGLRYEINTPFSEIRNRLNEWAPGQQSTVFPNAPKGLLFPGDPGVAAGIAPNYYKALMPRIGLAWDPLGDGKTTVRAAYGIFYDSFTNGAGGPLQAATSALPYTQFQEFSGPGFDIANPYGGQAPPSGTLAFPKPATVLTVDQTMRPPYVQNWNFSVERVIAQDYLLNVRYVGNMGTHLPRFVEANPSIYGTGATSENADQRRLYAGCPSSGGPCDFTSVGLISDLANSSYHSLQTTFSRRFSKALGFQASYWYSKSLDDVSSFNLTGSATRLVAGENDLAQNPFDLAAEHGPSIFDARHRLTISGSYIMPVWRQAPKAAAAFVNGWQLSGIGTFSSGTPFTVYDSANVSLQGSAPEITGFYASRPDLVGDPNAGPHTPEQWVSRSAFLRLDPVTQAGQFGNEGRNVVRGPGLANVDLSLMKGFQLGETRRLQFRAECFNIANHANFFLPEVDLASPAFGRITESRAPRLFQFALKFLF